jgi:hypothetical protein
MFGYEQGWNAAAAGLVFPVVFERKFAELRHHLEERYPEVPLTPELSGQFRVFDLREQAIHAWRGPTSSTFVTPPYNERPTHAWMYIAFPLRAPQLLLMNPATAYQVGCHVLPTGVLQQLFDEPLESVGT